MTKLRSVNFCSKYTEFALWASEVKKLDIEVLPKAEEKEMFRTFCEDYNTATLPHQKYYSLEDYERKRANVSAKRGLSEVCPFMRLLIGIFKYSSSSIILTCQAWSTINKRSSPNIQHMLSHADLCLLTHFSRSALSSVNTSPPKGFWWSMRHA